MRGRNAWSCGGSVWRAAICTSRRSTPASSMVVTKVCRNMCGCIRGRCTPAVSASRRKRRVAACRSIRPPRWFRKSGPDSRSSTARSMARPTAGGGERGRPLWLADHPQHPMAWTDRPLVPGDGPLLEQATLGNLNWREQRFIGRDVEVRPELRHYAQMVRERGDFGFVAERGGEPIGVVWAQLLPAGDPGYGFVDESTH